jgi:hypothetical protein
MTAPLVPPDIDIPRLQWVPVYTDRLWESNFFAVATDAEFKAAFCLWLKSWNQKPPGSLPTDDRLLCRLAELSGNLAKWRKVKFIALRHWIECDDGRLYHPVIAEFVIDASLKLNANRRRTISATKNRWKSTKEASVTDSVTHTGINRVITPPISPPFHGGDLFAKNGLKNGAARPPPVSPKLLGHGDVCMCANCTQWAELHQRRAGWTEN